MSILQTVTEEVAAWTQPVQAGQRVIVPTFSTYPSNSVVQVFIEGGQDTFLVSDGGGAIGTLHGAGGGGHDASPLRMLVLQARGKPFRVNKSGWIYMSPVSRAELTYAVGMVAEHSLRMAELLLRNFKPEPHHDFRQDLSLKFQLRFREAFTSGERLLGASNKLHKFDYVIRAAEHRTLVMDAVVPDSSSINAALVSHLDLKLSGQTGIRQAIIYDDHQDWKSSDLALLRVAAPPIAYSSFEGELADTLLAAEMQ
ncbi:MAG: hypothetical protein EON54_11845 [Alcaligenaceae bacterium]|nr:MAG: hypothetical protein EON54_11845 [Alcaligenaceae bacterium]